MNKGSTGRCPGSSGIRLRAAVVTLCLVFGIAACSEEAPSFPGPEGKAPPYILKQGCTFTIVEEYSRSSIESPKLSGVPGATATASISLGDLSISVADCQVSDNPQTLPIYEE